MAKIIKNKGTESISRDLIFDNELSDRARFVYCYMMAKPDNWDFYVGAMAKDLGYSEDTLHKYINELIDRGWLEKGEQSRDKDNKWGAVSYTIYEVRRQKKAVTENFRDGKTPPQKEIDFREIQDKKEETKKDKSFLSKKSFDFLSALLSIGIEEQIAKDWMKIRTSKKASDSETAFKQLKTALESINNTYGISATDAIGICVTNGWYGCKPSYFENIRLDDYGFGTQTSLFQQNNGKDWQ